MHVYWYLVSCIDCALRCSTLYPTSGYPRYSKDLVRSIIYEQSEMVVEIQQKKKRQAHHKTVGKRVGEGQSHHSPIRSSSPYRKKSPVGVTRCGGGIEEYIGEISSIRGGSFEISRLKRDLVASKVVVHYQKGELKR
ncbi:hypothetical protein H5410_001955 [Solanum commersonii]|uniref:Uncharacterized protein n=1 Tax=Solanum commersonii TaxID=4109 RepID=A0A9J6B0I4_SOLCO|nr:hypothetical protein H5410_001955 [Solanum commersonii]